jgi:hypothetical protein
MSKFIVHESGVVFDASECVVVDTDLFDDHDLARLSGDDFFDDGVIDEIAQRLGVAIPDAVDAARWDAYMNVPMTSSRNWCASCQNVDGSRRWVNPLTASVVPWDVMGDARSFAFVCDGCASGSAVAL